MLDPDCFLFCVEAKFASSLHDVRCLHNTTLRHNWRKYFKSDNSDEVQEYLLCDPGYMGVDAYILRLAERRELANGNNDRVVNSFNRRHAQQRVQVERGIGRLENRSRRYLEKLSNMRNFYAVFFPSYGSVTNCTHRGRVEFSIQYEAFVPTEPFGIMRTWST